nr:hypothetical protein [Bacteroidales bacterium]
EMTRAQEVEDERQYLLDNIQVGEIEARSISLDPDIGKALEKMNKIKDLQRQLPQIDCGMCGAPSCDALAEDIVCKGCKLTDCIFIQRNMESKKSIKVEESLKIMENIWGNEKIQNFVKKQITMIHNLVDHIKPE